MIKRKKIIFFGSDAIAIPVLETLLEKKFQQICEIVAVYSQPDRPSGRGQQIHSNAVVLWAKEHNIPVFQPEKLSEKDADILRSLNCDLGLVMAYGHILKKYLLETPPLGFFNFHASLLPHYRGPAPIEAAIANNDTGAGVTLQKITEKLDEGDIVGSAVIPLNEESTRLTLRSRISELCVFITKQTLPEIIYETAMFIPQKDKHVSYTRKISRLDSAINFYAPASEIAARVRAFSPWPGCTFSFENFEIKIGSCTTLSCPEIHKQEPGTVIDYKKGELLIATGKDFLQIHSLQRPGGKMLQIKDFLAGLKIPAGTILNSREMIPISQPKPWKKINIQ